MEDGALLYSFIFQQEISTPNGNINKYFEQVTEKLNGFQLLLLVLIISRDLALSYQQNCLKNLAHISL